MIDDKIVVLAVDDDNTHLKILEKILGDDKTVVVSKQGAQSALEFLDDHEIDIVITDLIMPQMDGLTFLERIRNRPQYKTIPVLLWSALDARASKKDFLIRYAPVDLLPKGETTDVRNRIRSYAALMRHVRNLEKN